MKQMKASGIKQLPTEPNEEPEMSIFDQTNISKAEYGEGGEGEDGDIVNLEKLKKMEKYFT